MPFKFCIGEPSTRKTYQVEKDVSALIGMRVGQEFDGDLVGLGGFRLKITGGSDKEGFPMRAEIDGSARKKILMGMGVGFRGRKKIKKNVFKRPDMRKRKLVRGNVISSEIAQVNLKIVSGTGDVGLILGVKKEGGSGEKKED